MSHVLWESLVYGSLRKQSVSKFQELLRDGFECFETLDSYEKAYLVLDSELWDDDFSSLPNLGLHS